MSKVDLQQLVERIIERNRNWTQEGETAEYIPELKKADPAALGLTVLQTDGKEFSAGEHTIPFTLQSISKVFSLLLALLDQGEEKVFEKVGMEPTGDPFNSIIKLETKQPAKPLNPMINAGAIAVTGLVRGASKEEKFQRILAFIRKVAGNTKIKVNEAVYSSEKRTGDRNRSLAFFLKDVGALEADPLETVDIYFRQCAIEVTCLDLARMALFLARQGVVFGGAESLIPPRYIRIVKTFMVTCGMYDGSGEFAINVGIPAKSGVSGGIMALVPNKMGIGVFGPALDRKGNSIAGIHVLADLSDALQLSIF
ncbi:MAG: glutaminase A [Dethiobacteria bacterium]